MSHSHALECRGRRIERRPWKEILRCSCLANYAFMAITNKMKAIISSVFSIVVFPLMITLAHKKNARGFLLLTPLTSSYI